MNSFNSTPVDFRTPRRYQIWAAVLLAVIALLMAGCGGGGGGGGTSGSTGGTPAPATLQGTVDFNGAPAAGYTVKFGTGGVLTATTNTQGVFQISFDASQHSGSQPLLIYDTNGALIDKETVTVNAAGGTQNIGTVNVGPPAPP